MKVLAALAVALLLGGCAFGVVTRGGNHGVIVRPWTTPPIQAQ